MNTSALISSSTLFWIHEFWPKSLSQKIANKLKNLDYAYSQRNVIIQQQIDKCDRTQTKFAKYPFQYLNIVVIYFVPSRSQVSRCHSLQNLDTDFNRETELTFKSKSIRHWIVKQQHMNKTILTNTIKVKKQSIVSYRVLEEPSLGKMNSFHLVVVTQCIFCGRVRAYECLMICLLCH